MPLRSVEAATRDDAIAAAREQFGPQARVVGVRRVRSGGVLGFFATERYVAEVAPDAGRPPVPTPGRGTRDDDLGSSPLASASPATAAPTSARTRASAPARNGAAAYAAEAVRSPEPARPATQAAARSLGWTVGLPAEAPVDDARVSELAGLLGAPAAEPKAASYVRPAYPRSGGIQMATFAKAPWTAALDDEDDAPEPELPSSSAPSPFTAALARMVAGDTQVRQAVEDAIGDIEDRSPAAQSPAGAERRPVRSAPARTADTAVWPRAARQEEETVGDQVIAPPSMSELAPVEVPTWVAEPEVATAPDSSREEAIAEVLRSALAQGHSDEALAGILRKVLDGVAPQAALPEPELRMSGNVVAVEPPVAPVAVEPVPSAPLFAEPVTVVETPAVAEPTSMFEAPVVDAPVYEAPTYQAPTYQAPVFPTPTYQAPVRPSFVFEPFAPSALLPAIDIWGGSSSTPLWGEATTTPPVARTDAPIWAEVVLGEPAHPAASEPVEEVADETRDELFVETFDEPVAEPVLEALMDESDIPVDEIEIAEIEVLGVEVPWVEAVEVAEVEVAEVAEVEVAEVEADEIEAEVVELAVDTPVVAEIEVPVATVEAVVETPAVAEIEVAEVEVVTEFDVTDTVAEETAAEAVDVAEEIEVEVESAVEEIAPLLARTASDPAPFALPMSMSLDATSVMPPLSLLPPLPSSRGRGRPPVPPVTSRRPVPPSRPASEAAPETPEVEEQVPVLPPVTGPATKSWATVTRLPVAPLMAGPDIPELTEKEIARLENPDMEIDEPEVVDLPAPAAVVNAPVAPTAKPAADAPKPVQVPGDVVSRLAALGLPTQLLGASFPTDVERHGLYAALTRALGLRLPAAPELPTGAGEVLFVVGPGVETLRAARRIAASLCLDPDRVQWATCGDLAGLAPEGSRVTTVDGAMARRQDASHAGTVTIVAVDAPMRADAYWMRQMLAIWSPVAVWAVVEATRKPEDVEPWLDSMARVDALIVQDTDLSADPAAVLHRVAAPVAVLDGIRATPHRWASLLCERLEGTDA